MPHRVLTTSPLLARAASWLTLGLLCVCATGCVQRRMTIRSNPPGARVIVDGTYEIGTTPCSTAFTYYGTRNIMLIKDGYETLTVKQPFPTPWYEYFPLDFFSENVVPGEIRDERVVDYNLVPLRMVPTDQLLGRAEQLRRQARPAGAISPAPAYDPYGRQPGLFSPPPSPGVLPPPAAAPIGPGSPLPAPLLPGGSSPTGGANWSSDGIR